MKKRDLLIAGLILANVSVFAQPGVTEPIHYDDDAEQMFFQGFEGSANWKEIKLSADDDTTRNTRLFTWQADPVDRIDQITYYKREGSSNPSSNTDIYSGEKQWQVAGIRDTTMLLYDGVLRTDAALEDKVLDFDSHAIGTHTTATKEGAGIGGEDYGLSRYGEQDNAGTQYFIYNSGIGSFDGTTVGGQWGGWSSTSPHVASYRRNLFVRNIKIQPNSSYRVTVFVKATTKFQSQDITPQVGVDLLRGYFHSEKPFQVDFANDASTFDDKSSFSLDDAGSLRKDNEREGKWQKVVLMAYYNNDSLGNASAYRQSYYWAGDWNWKVGRDADGAVVNDLGRGMARNAAGQLVNDPNAKDTTTLTFIQQPAKYFVRLSFKTDSTEYLVDNLSLTKSWIAGVEHHNDMIRIDFGYETNLGKLAEEAMEKNKIAAVEVPGDYFTVWGKWEGSWYPIKIRSAEYHGDGYMYMWTEDDEDGSMISFEGAEQVLVSFTNPEEKELKLYYTGKRYPNGLDAEWIANGKPVFDFHNEISSLNPTIDYSPKTKEPVRSLKDLPPVLQAATFEDGTFGLDPNRKEFTFKFSRNLAFDNTGISSKLTKVILRGNGVTEYWNVKDYGDIKDGFTTVVRPDNYKTVLKGDYVLSIEQITHLPEADPSNSLDYSENQEFNYHFGTFDPAPEVKVVKTSDWRSEITEEGAWDRPVPASLYTYNKNDGFYQGTGLNFSPYKKNGLYKMVADEKYGNCFMYITAYDKNKAGIWGTLYTVENLKAGNYTITFPAFGWGTNDTETKVYVYAKPSEITYENLTGATKTEIGKFIPTANTSWSGNDSEKNWTSDVKAEKIAMCEYQFSIPSDGDYVIEWANKNNAGSQTYYGVAIGNYTIKTAGDLSFIPVNNLNLAKKAAADQLTAADAAKYRGDAYTSLTQILSVANNYISMTAATNINKPSEYAAQTKTVKDATNALQLRMDTVNLFDKAIVDAQAKIDLYGLDSLNDYVGIPELAALKALKNSFASYAYASKSTAEITADINALNDGVKAVESRQALNFSFPGAKAYAQLYADSAKNTFGEESDDYKSIVAAIAHANAFDSIACTYAELKAEILALTDAAFYPFNKEEIAKVATVRIDSLYKLAVAYGADLAALVPSSKLAEVQARIQNVAFDDDELADILKNVIKIAIYDKIVKGEAVDGIDLTPFIKNYHFYATVKGVVDNSDLELPGARDNARAKGYNHSVSQIQKIGHQWGQGALDKKCWVMLLDTEYDDLFPGWTVKSFTTSNHSMVSPDNSTNSYSHLSAGETVFDGQILMDWNSKAQIKQSIEGLPVGIYTLSVSVPNNAGGTSTVLNATSDKGEYTANVSGGKAKIENIAVREIGKMDIDFTLASGSGGSDADNFSLTFNQDKDVWFSQYYPVLYANAVSELDNRVTVVDAADVEGATVEYSTLSGIALDAPIENQVILRKTTTSDGTVVVDKIISK